MKHGQLSLESLETIIRQMPDNGLAANRMAALAHLGEHGLPTLRDEDWKYTDLASVVDISNRWLAAGGENQATTRQHETIDALTKSIDALWLVIANGRIDERYLQGFDDSAVRVSRFSDAPAPLSIERPLANLNAALLQDGLRIRIDGTPGKPLGILFFDQSAGGAGVTQSAIEIEVATGAAAEIVEYHVSDGDDLYANTVLSIVAGDSASVRHVRIQNRGLQHVHTGRTSIALGRSATLRMAGYDLGGGLIRNDVDINLSHPGADVSFDGLYLAGDGQHIDNHTRVDHRVGPSMSAQEYRGILNGRCRCVWNGKAIVHNGADGTDATQSNHNLLLSENAEIDAKPELEIYAEDVKCSHGTTVGQLDETALFYLRSRGLDRRHAAQVLTHAFAADLVLRAPVDAANSVISSIVAARLETLIKTDIAAEFSS